MFPLVEHFDGNRSARSTASIRHGDEMQRTGGGGETVGAGRVSRIWAAGRNHAPSLGSINTFLVGEWLPRGLTESSEEPGESGRSMR